MIGNTIESCELIELQKIGDRQGFLSVINENKEIPFKVKRIFYLYDIQSGESRGAHAHIDCHQFLIAISGSFEVLIDDSQNKKLIFLNSPNIGLHIPPGIWASEINFSSGAICLVLASEEYNEEDYIRNYNNYLIYKNER